MFRFPHSSSDSSHFEMSCDSAKDLRINKSLSDETSPKIKEEMLPPPQRRFGQSIESIVEYFSVKSLPAFRYFCIFCKMDFLSADEFLDHLEMHPNGTFVLVKRDIPPPPTQVPSEPLEPEEIPTPDSPILPEMLGNQIKVRDVRDKIICER